MTASSTGPPVRPCMLCTGAYRLALGELDLLEEGDDLLLPVDAQVPATADNSCEHRPAMMMLRREVHVHDSTDLQRKHTHSRFRLAKGLDAFECQMYGLPVFTPRPRWSSITCTSVLSQVSTHGATVHKFSSCFHLHESEDVLKLGRQAVLGGSPSSGAPCSTSRPTCRRTGPTAAPGP